MKWKPIAQTFAAALLGFGLLKGCMFIDRDAMKAEDRHNAKLYDAVARAMCEPFGSYREDAIQDLIELSQKSPSHFWRERYSPDIADIMSDIKPEDCIKMGLPFPQPIVNRERMTGRNKLGIDHRE